MSRVIVIGAGLAGLVAANRLADGGAQVTVLTKGIGGLQLGQGTIDVLGYTPERVAEPLAALASLDAGHPYAAIGAARVGSALTYLQQLLPDLLVGDPQSNMLLPTAVGALRPTCLAQPSMLAGRPQADRKLVIVGLRRLKDFQPELVAQNLARTDLPGGGRLAARSLMVDVAARDQEIDSSGLTFARAFDDAGFRSRFADLLAPQLQPGEVVGLPAVLGLNDHTAWRQLADLLGREVFEIPLPPPSVPGMRLNQALTDRALAAGVRLVPGVATVAFSASSGRVDQVSIATAPAPRTFAGDAFVLATGGFESGALTLDSHGDVTESVFGLPLAGLDAGPLVHGDYWGAEQPLFRVGVSVDPELRPCQGGTAIYANLRAAGGIIAGSSRWAEKSGDGIAVASAVAAAESILKEL